MSNKTMTIREKIDYFADALDQGLITFPEFKRLTDKVAEECPHENTRTYVDEYDYYVSCEDCEKDL